MDVILNMKFLNIKEIIVIYQQKDIVSSNVLIFSVKLYEGLSTLRNKKLKINNTLFEKFKDMSENPDFEQDYWSRTAEGIYKIGHDSIL